VCSAEGRLPWACGCSTPKPPHAVGVFTEDEGDGAVAIYHLHASIIGRSDGRSAVAAAAYRAGQSVACRETGDTHDYTRKGGVVSAEVIAPDAAPAWATDRAALWNAVHAKETRKNSQLAREVRVALPHDLTDAEAAEMLRAWVRAEFVDRGMIADVCVHDPDPEDEDDSRNRHAHILLTMRPLDPTQPDGWAKNKDRTWNAPDTLDRWRASWAEAQNAALARAGSSARVDHRSLADQRAAAVEAEDHALADALDRPPLPRMGLASIALERAAKRQQGAAWTGPATDRGQAQAAARTLRAALLDRLREFRDAAARLAGLEGAETRPGIAGGRVARMFSLGDHATKAAPSSSKPDPTPDAPGDDWTPSPS